MSYLETLVEQAPSGMEIDWFDTRSLHIGAFAQGPGYEKLIGTTRLITTEPLNGEQAQMTRDLARRDPVLDYLVNGGAVQALLPVLQSQEHLIAHLQMAMEDEDELLLGEVSRVVVHVDYRGAGLSRELTKFAIAEAERAGVFELFLECLPIHEKVYRQVGFQTMPCSGKVYSVNKTMAVMHQPLGHRSLLRKAGEAIAGPHRAPEPRPAQTAGPALSHPQRGRDRASKSSRRRHPID
jgi:predicted GNAT family N-acyltransferase